MSGSIAYPFLRASDRSVHPVDWRVSAGESLLDQGCKFVPGWDYQTPICATRAIEINPEAIAEDLAIAGQPLRGSIVARLGTGTGTMPRQWIRVIRIPLEAGKSHYTIDFRVVGNELSGRLHLATDIVIDAADASKSALSPRAAGSRIWGDVLRVDLEGIESRFPIEQLDFGKYFFGTPESNAPWMLHWSPGDLNRGFHGAVRLLVNDANKEFVRRLTENDLLLQQSMMGEVKAQLIQGCLELESDLSLYRREEPGTLGAVVLEWIESLWPGESGEAVIRKCQVTPGRFRAAVMASVEMPEVPK